MAWGVVTMTAPASCVFALAFSAVVAKAGWFALSGVGALGKVAVVVFVRRVSIREMCSSDVPGGVSMRR